MSAPHPNYNYEPYFKSVCALPADVKIIYLKGLRIASIIVTRNLYTREQIRGVLAVENFTKADADRLAVHFPEGIFTFPE